ncbi:MAG TPA: tripartite tricarboxylate transporter substrate binding protein [Casimicrobiaceae bacterium]|nr:tripartite tricarboxylate transporter substrate binding protein [Casimicrobiaceae bacterium]
MRAAFGAALFAMAIGITAGDGALAADAFPNRPIKIVVNTAPGGFTDLMARLAAQYVGDCLKQPVIVDNRAGGDGMIAIRFVKSSPADGYTLLAATGTAAQQMALREDPGYDLLKDFTGIGIITRTPFLMVVGAGQPDKTVADFIACAKANPGKLAFVSAGVGTVPHFASERFLQALGVKVLHVPYKGNAPALPDVISGRVDMIFDTYRSSIGQIKAGQFRVLGVTSSARLPVLPDVKTLIEQGTPGYSYYMWVCLLAPAGTPPAVMQRLSDSLKYAKAKAEVKERFRNKGMESVDMTPAQFNQFLANEVTQNRKIVADLHLEKQ